MIDAPIFCEMKGLIETHKCGKFHQYSIFHCEVIYLQRFSEQQKVGFLAASGWFVKDYPPPPRQMKSGSYKSFTSHALQANASYILRFFRKR